MIDTTRLTEVQLSSDILSTLDTLADEVIVAPWEERGVATVVRPLVRPLPTLEIPYVPPAGNRSRTYQVVKRALDIVGALAAIALFSPIMLVTFLILCVTTKGRPLFRQERIGLSGRKIWLYKFRTMHLNADQMQHLVKNEKDGPIFKNRRDPRVTTIGRFLRRTSIDELPQLFNVLLGSMSLVGPRPPVAKEVVKYEPWQLQRLAVKPGLTCLWQVSGRSEIGFEDWMKMDVWYVDHQSLWEDIKLLVRTPVSVLSGRGAY